MRSTATTSVGWGGFAEYAVAPASALSHKPAALTFFMRSMGADEVVDYCSHDFTRMEPFDHVLDLVAHRSVFAYRRWLSPRGRYRCFGGSVRALLRVITAGALLGRLTGRSLGVLLVKLGPAHFEPMADLCVSGDIDIHIDRTYSLDDVPQALEHVGEGRALGKVVVEVA